MKNKMRDGCTNCKKCNLLNKETNILYYLYLYLDTWKIYTRYEYVVKTKRFILIWKHKKAFFCFSINTCNNCWKRENEKKKQINWVDCRSESMIFRFESSHLIIPRSQLFSLTKYLSSFHPHPHHIPALQFNKTFHA